MLRPSTRIQLILFVIITLVGVSYVSAKYIGLTPSFLGPTSCTVQADFPDSGGIFTDAEVTYRGVTVGRVGTLHLINKGVRVDLKLTDCTHPEIPASAAASVSDRSVIGEQYVNLIPPNGKGPFLKSGSLIPMSRNSIPVSAQQLLTSLDSFVNSVPLDKLRTVVSELGKAFNDRGDDLARLLTSTNSLLDTAQANLPQTIDLIESAQTVLNRQLAEQQPLQSFTHSLELLTGQLKRSDPDLRRLLTDGPTSLGTLRNFITNNRTDLGVTIANLASDGQLLVRHLDGIEQVLELYPALAAGGQSIISNHTAALGLVISNINDPPDCGDPRKGSEGYQGTTIRSPSQTSPAAPNTAARCTAPVSSGTNIRGSAHVPGGDPISTTGGGVAYPRGTTDNTVRIGTQLNRAGALGDSAWLALLTDSLN